mmetsp:Transcript_27637/g.52617  ORF Transcript_27637/g.52617 Transcript_27637/m.52617 type:complete len:238 (-) Transcript_27637:880-1593(-)
MNVGVGRVTLLAHAQLFELAVHRFHLVPSRQQTRHRLPLPPSPCVVLPPRSLLDDDVDHLGRELAQQLVVRVIPRIGELGRQQVGCCIQLVHGRVLCMFCILWPVPVRARALVQSCPRHLQPVHQLREPHAMRGGVPQLAEHVLHKHLPPLALSCVVHGHALSHTQQVGQPDSLVRAGHHHQLQVRSLGQEAPKHCERECAVLPEIHVQHHCRHPGKSWVGAQPPEHISPRANVHVP